MEHIIWPNKKAIGSCYCLDQSPGCERVGGVTVVIRRRRAEAGTIALGEPYQQAGSPELSAGLAQELADIAEKGVRAAAEELHVNLEEFDVLLQEFLLHVVDSRVSIFQDAAKSAFISAYAGWRRFRE